MAVRLIGEFAADWEPEKYTDDYRRNLMEIVKAKRDRTKPELEAEEEPQSARVVDLMERLRKSLGQARGRKGAGTRRGAARRTGAASRKSASRGRKKKAA